MLFSSMVLSTCHSMQVVGPWKLDSYCIWPVYVMSAFKKQNFCYFNPTAVFEFLSYSLELITASNNR